jgi:hypothetical protein
MPAQTSVLANANRAKRLFETACGTGTNVIPPRLSRRLSKLLGPRSSGANLRIWLAALVLAAMGAESAGAQSSVESGCERKDPDPVYCHDGKPRAVCLENGRLVWRDTHDAISQGELIFLTKGGPVPKPSCSEKPKD